MNIINLLWKDLKESFCNKKIWMFFTIVSAIIIAGTYCAMKENEKEAKPIISVGVVDNDSSSYSNMLVNYFKESEEISQYADIIVATEDEIKNMFEHKEIIGYLVIPEHFVENLISIENTPIKVVIGTENTTIAVLFHNILKSYEKYISSVEVNCAGLYEIMQYEQRPQELTEKKNMDISMKLIFMALGRHDLFEVHEMESAEQVSVKQYYIHSCIVIVLLFGSMFAGFSYLYEKENKTLERLKLAGIQDWKYLLYKIVVSCTCCDLLLLCLYGIAGILSDSGSGMDECMLYTGFLSGCIALSILLAYFCKSTKVYILVTGTTYFMLYIIGGGVMPMMYMPRVLYAIGQYSPVYWILQALDSCM